jgi:hypothetical protein
MGKSKKIFSEVPVPVVEAAKGIKTLIGVISISGGLRPFYRKDIKF